MKGGRKRLNGGPHTVEQAHHQIGDIEHHIEYRKAALPVPADQQIVDDQEEQKLPNILGGAGEAGPIALEHGPRLRPRQPKAEDIGFF